MRWTSEGMDVVLQASDAEEVLAVAGARPHAVVVDVRMPPTHTTEGLDAAERIKADHPEIGVLVLSASLQEGRQAAARTPPTADRLPAQGQRRRHRRARRGGAHGRQRRFGDRAGRRRAARADSGAQVGEHGEHAAVALVGGGEVELLEDRPDVALDGARAQEEPVADRRVRAPSAMSARISRSRSVKDVEADAGCGLASDQRRRRPPGRRRSRPRRPGGSRRRRRRGRRRGP